MADMTPVKLTKQELLTGTGATAPHQEALDWIRRVRLPIGNDLPDDVIFNLGPFRFVSELWRVLKPGGRAFLTEFGIEEGWPAPVKLPGHTEYEVQYSHLRQAVRWLGFHEQYLCAPAIPGDETGHKSLCTGAAYTIQRFCQAMNKPFVVRAYTEQELKAYARRSTSRNFRAPTTMTWPTPPGSVSLISKSSYWKNQAGRQNQPLRKLKVIGGTVSGERGEGGVGWFPVLADPAHVTIANFRFRAVLGRCAQ